MGHLMYIEAEMLAGMVLTTVSMRESIGSGRCWRIFCRDVVNTVKKQLTGFEQACQRLVIEARSSFVVMDGQAFLSVVIDSAPKHIKNRSLLK
jgi:hypothetical protein